MALSPEELDELGDEVTALFDKTCTIKRQAYVDDGYGGRKASGDPATIASDVPILLTAPSLALMAQLGQTLREGSITVLRAMLPLVTAVQRGDLLILDNAPAAEATWRIEDSFGQQSYQAVLTILLSQVQ